MAPPDTAKAAPALAKRSLHNGPFSGATDSEPTPTKSAKQTLVDRLDVIEHLSHWKLELQARLWRKKVTFLYADVDVDFGQLSDEVRDFKRVSAVLTYMRRQRP
jgi:hypothetical protein